MDKTITGLSALSVIAFFCIIIAGCSGSTPDQPSSYTIHPVVSVKGNTADASSVADANNRFAFDLYSQLAGNPETTNRTIFFSPFSIYSAFALTYEGARGATADEIRSVFHIPAGITTLREGFARLSSGINSGKAVNTLRTANAIWAQETYPFLPEYTSTAAQYYGANTTNLDFIGKPEDSRQTINRWIEEKTEEKIRDMLPTGSIGGATRLVITNAIYFKGKWEKPFAEKDTRNREFYLDDTYKNSVTVPMMQRKGNYAYKETDTFQMVELPYKAGDGSDLSMIAILPKKYGLPALTEVEESLNPTVISDLERDLTDTKISLLLPKFHLETEYKLPHTLKEMGMRSAFERSADFSGMDGTRSLFISDVFHKAFIDVNEEGTEAAASSAIVISQGGPPPEPFFVADHPFFFFIREKETGTILFMGRIANPAGQ